MFMERDTRRQYFRHWSHARETRCRFTGAVVEGGADSAS